MSTAQVLEQPNGSGNEDRDRPLVLLAEDNEDTRGIYGLILRHYGYEVEEAVNGTDAIAKTRERMPNLVLMDIAMPELDGWEASRALKSDPETTAIPVIAFSANIDSTADLRGNSTFDGYILKPVSPTDLVRRVQSYCELLDITPRRTDS